VPRRLDPNGITIVDRLAVMAVYLESLAIAAYVAFFFTIIFVIGASGVSVASAGVTIHKLSVHPLQPNIFAAGNGMSLFAVCAFVSFFAFTAVFVGAVVFADTVVLARVGLVGAIVDVHMVTGSFGIVFSARRRCAAARCRAAVAVAMGPGVFVTHRCVAARPPFTPCLGSATTGVVISPC